LVRKRISTRTLEEDNSSWFKFTIEHGQILHLILFRDVWIIMICAVQIPAHNALMQWQQLILKNKILLVWCTSKSGINTDFAALTRLEYSARPDQRMLSAFWIAGDGLWPLLDVHTDQQDLFFKIIVAICINALCARAFERTKS